MRRIIVGTFASLDGVMQAPGGPAEDPIGGFTLGGWTAPHFDEALGGAMGEIFGQPFDLLLGRKTYDIFAAHWPLRHRCERSHRRPLQPGDEICCLAHQAEARLAEQPISGGRRGGGAEETEKHGRPRPPGAGLRRFPTQTLWQHGLVDEFSVLTFPVVLGSGNRMFGSGAVPAALKLVKSKAYPTGVIVSHYTPDGAVKIGDFQLPEPSDAETERRRKLT